MKEITNESLLKALCEYIQYNWNASLGYGKDRMVLESATDEFDWVMKLLGIDKKYFIDFYLKNY